MNRTAILRAAGALLCAMAVSGCVSLLPKSKPATLYRFGQAPASGAPSPASGTVGVFRAGGSFQREAGGDRLLTVTGEKAAYIAGTRWVSPAAVLFDEAVLAAFDADAGKVRLISRGEPGKASYAMRLDVRNFEARYDHGPKAAPQVVIRVRATLTRDQDRELVSEQFFEAGVRAADNRVGAIVPAYDKAVAEILGKLVAWANAAAS